MNELLFLIALYLICLLMFTHCVKNCLDIYYAFRQLSYDDEDHDVDDWNGDQE